MEPKTICSKQIPLPPLTLQIREGTTRFNYNSPANRNYNSQVKTYYT